MSNIKGNISQLNLNAIPQIVSSDSNLYRVDIENGFTIAEGANGRTKPFISITDAIANVQSGDIIRVNRGVYEEDLIIPAGVSLINPALNQVTIQGDVTLEGPGVPISIQGIIFGGVNKTLTIDCTIDIKDSYSYSKVVLGANAHITTSTFNIRPNEIDADALTINVDPDKTIYMLGATIEAKGNGRAVVQNSGSFVLLSSETLCSNVNPSVLSVGGTLIASASRFINTGGGAAIDIAANDGAISSPNALDGVVVAGNVVCGDKYTVIDGLHFIAGALSGTAIEFRSSDHIKNNSAVTGDTSTEALDHLDNVKLELDSNDNLVLPNIISAYSGDINNLLPWYEDNAPDFVYDRALTRVRISQDGTHVLLGADQETPSPNYPYLSTDGGKTYNAIISLDDKWHDFGLSADGSIQFACAFANKVYRSADNGVNWMEVLDEADMAATTVSVSNDGQYVLVASASGGPYIGKARLSTDYGLTFTNIPQFDGIGSSEGIVNHDGSRMYVATQSATFISTDYGINWIQIYNKGLKPLRISRNADVLIGVIRIGPPWGPLVVSPDNGVTWNTVSGLPSDIHYLENYIAVSDDGNVIIISYMTSVGLTNTYTSFDKGNSWVETPIQETSWKSVTINGTGTKAIGLRNENVYLTEDFKKSLFNVQGDITGSTIGIINNEINSLNTLVSPVSIASSVIYVDDGRTDVYVETGSINQPFKTWAAAVAAVPVGGTLKVAEGTYVGNVTLPDGVSVEGWGSNRAVLTGTLSTGTSPLSLKNLQMQGEVTINGACNMFDCFYTQKLTITGSAPVQAWNSHLVPSAGITALDMQSTGKFQIFLSTIASTGDVLTVEQSAGQIILNTTQVTGSRASALVSPTGGTFVGIASQIINNAGGISLDLSNNDATSTNPNMLSDILSVGNVVCGTKSTLVEGLQFLVTGTLTGTALTYRKSSMISDDSAVTGDTVKDPAVSQL